MTARGFVLVNALVIVAALSAAAVVLLARAEASRTRQVQTQTSDQLDLYLDSFESLVMTVLTADAANGALDHLAEGWAQRDYDVTLDRGRVNGRIEDLQGRFNINWLSRPDDDFARQGFAVLVASLGVAPQVTDRLAAHLGPSGPVDQSAYEGRDPAVRIIGGPLVVYEQLALVPGLDAETLQRMRPYIAVLPSDSPWNVNTAPPLVLQAMLPGIGLSQAQVIDQRRRNDPFGSVEAFLLSLGADAEGLDETRFAVGSTWFRVSITAQLDGADRTRHTVFERQPLPDGVRVAYRLDDGT